VLPYCVHMGRPAHVVDMTIAGLHAEFIIVCQSLFVFIGRQISLR